MNYSKEELNSTGIYCILNLVNGKQYIGSTARSFKQRWGQHRNRLNQNKHPSKHLQHSWNKHTESSFQFIIIEYCLPEDCITREQYYLDSLCVCNPEFGYNTAPTAGSCLGIKRSEATKSLMSLALKGKVLSVEHKAKLSTAKTGTTQSAEHIANKAKAKLKTYIATNPLGVETLVDNLKQFCLDADLSYTCMVMVSIGVSKQHRSGWLCRPA